MTEMYHQKLAPIDNDTVFIQYIQSIRSFFPWIHASSRCLFSIAYTTILVFIIY